MGNRVCRRGEPGDGSDSKNGGRERSWASQWAEAGRTGILCAAVALSAVSLGFLGWAANAGALGNSNGRESSDSSDTAPMVRVLLPMVARDENGGQLSLGAADDGMSFAVVQGSTVVVTLASNPSTGFRWEIASPLTGPLVQIGTAEYIPSSTTSPIVGAGGLERFRFEAVSVGTAVLELIYHRSFEPTAAPLRTFSVTLVVQ